MGCNLPTSYLVDGTPVTPYKQNVSRSGYGASCARDRQEANRHLRGSSVGWVGRARGSSPNTRSSSAKQIAAAAHHTAEARESVSLVLKQLLNSPGYIRRKTLSKPLKKKGTNALHKEHRAPSSSQIPEPDRENGRDGRSTPEQRDGCADLTHPRARWASRGRR
ncbi:hypothetical protein AGOR_G00149890 [Albula goreensis]|uniref:Uncharacterized protein n=1 Tax=Albula goreensis TaxID=1534307 RepID=A0A8T3D7A4_9TELE|nr:hypothetical protein AGOR_G00149890 [Albula goreensis]